mmetsp:Transcript_114966/g.330177  ORF Transcript_114966/g.330177 Transcript_114966/m.330177 type:complete len:293 (-) Transcript_114966:93-971(-)
MPAEDLEFGQGFVRPQRLVASLVLQALLVVLDGGDKVALLHRFVALLAEPLRRLRLLRGVAVALLDVSLHGLELRVVLGNDGVALVLRVSLRLPELPSLVVDVAAAAEQLLRLFPADPLVLAELVRRAGLLVVVQLPHELLPSILLGHHLVRLLAPHALVLREVDEVLHEAPLAPPLVLGALALALGPVQEELPPPLLELLRADLLRALLELKLLVKLPEVRDRPVDDALDLRADRVHILDPLVEFPAADGRAQAPLGSRRRRGEASEKLGVVQGDHGPRWASPGAMRLGPG